MIKTQHCLACESGDGHSHTCGLQAPSEIWLQRDYPTWTWCDEPIEPDDPHYVRGWQPPSDAPDRRYMWVTAVIDVPELSNWRVAMYVWRNGDKFCDLSGVWRDWNIVVAFMLMPDAYEGEF